MDTSISRNSQHKSSKKTGNKLVVAFRDSVPTYRSDMFIIIKLHIPNNKCGYSCSN